MGDSSGSGGGGGGPYHAAPAALSAPQRWLRLVIKDGLVAAAPGGDGAGAPFASVNELL
jgi:hypothetical protein